MASTNPFWSLATPVGSYMPQAISDRLSARLSQSDHIRVPSSDDVHTYYNTTPDSAWSQKSFQEVDFTYDTSKGKILSNSGDTSSAQTRDWPLTEKYYSISATDYDIACPKRTLWKTILLPTLAIILPMAFLVAGLLGVIFGYRVKSDDSLFPQVSNSQVLSNHAVVLVNYSATRIAFVASWASTLAPLLAGFIMNLTSFQAALQMYRSSTTSQQDLPTPYQYSILIGLCLANSGRLRRYFSYSSTDGVVIPPVLRRAARTLAMTLLLACVVFGADTALHYTTSTINFDQVSVAASSHAYGYGLSSACLELNRTANLGFPCSRNGITAQTNYDEYVSGQNEIFYLRHGTSNTSEIRLADVPSDQASNISSTDKVALLIPQSAALSTYRDFQAYTTGVVATCKPISSQCNWTSGGPNFYYSSFNCSNNFWGILGQAVNTTTTSTGVYIDDSSIPPLGFKPSGALQYSFFMDKELSIPYDSAGYLGPPMPNSELINPVYMGMAGRFQSTAQRAGVNMSSDAGVYQGPTQYIDFTLKCQYTTYLVDYNWVNSSVQINTLTPSPNGTLAEMYHGYNIVGSSNSFDNDLQDFVLEAALQSNAQDLANSFAKSYSSRVMAVIGPFLSSRSNLQEQTRTPLLVAKVPKIPLAILIAGCCCYIIFGVVSAAFAYRALRNVDVRDIAFGFSLPALGLHAFRDTRVETDASVVDGSSGHRIFNEEKIKSETIRVAVDGDPKTGFTLKGLL